MKVQRKELLAKLAELSAGLSSREILEQSNAFTFHEGSILTFNDEIQARCDSPLDMKTTIVGADDLLKVLERFPDEEIDIVRKEAEIIIKGKRRRAGIACMSETLLPFGDVPAPKSWKKLRKETTMMLRQAARTCGQDETQYLTTCVHAMPNLVEACDNYRLFRATGVTGFPKEVLIPAASLKAIEQATLVKVSIGKGWCHFLTASGTTYTVRCPHQQYHDGVDDLLKVKKGKKIRLPTNLREILDRAAIMNEGGYDAWVTISIADNLLKVTSRKDSGWFREQKRIKYDGQPLSFFVNPKFLLEVLERTRTVTVNPKRLKIETDKIQFVVALRQPDEITDEKDD